jgi:hypothetical protein
MPPASSESSASASRPRAALIAAWLFPALLGLLATLYLGGRLGKNTDGYSINLRDVVTSKVPWPFNPLKGYMYVWRPLHHTMRYTIATFWPDADRPVHIGIALGHLAACFMLWRVMRRLTRTAIAPAVAAILFMVIPLHGEVTCWFDTTSTAIAAAICFACVFLAIRYTLAPSLRLLLALLLVTFAVPCFYEQSGALAAAVPFACLAVSPSLPWRTRLTRAFVATSTSGIACLTYIVLLVLTSPKNTRGGLGSFISLSNVSGRFHEFLGSLHFNSTGERGRQIFLGSINLGWQTVATPRGLIFGSILLASAILWLVWAHAEPPRSRGGSVDPRPKLAPPSPVWLPIAGIIIFFSSFLPLFVVDHQIVESRNLYIPLMGAAFVLAALVDALCSALPSPILRTVIAALAIAASIPGTLGLIGFQALFQARYDLDQRELSHLQSLFPNPAPNTLFVPLLTRPINLNTGYPLFEECRGGVFETPWSASDAVQWMYHRKDVDATSATPRGPSRAISAIDDRGLHWDPTVGLANSGHAHHDAANVSWDDMVPFIVTPTDEPIRLIRRIDIEKPDHRDLVIHPPRVVAVMTAHPTTSTALYRYVAGEPGADLIDISLWDYADGTPVKFDDMWMWSETPSNVFAKAHPSTWLTPLPGPRHSMSVSMPPLDRPEHLLLRATIAAYDLFPPTPRPIAPAVVELVVTMRDAPDKELAVLRLDPAHLRKARKWLPLIVTLPPRLKPAGDRIVVTIRRAADDPSPPDAPLLSVWVTPGYEQAIPLESNSK